jgi:hypothetical protein
MSINGLNTFLKKELKMLWTFFSVINIFENETNFFMWNFLLYNERNNEESNELESKNNLEKQAFQALFFCNW